MQFISFFIKYFFLTFLIACSASKPEVNQFDIKRVVQRVSEVRVSLQMKPHNSNVAMLNDYQIFLDACQTYRIDSDNAMVYLKQTNFSLFNYLESLKNELYK